MRRVYKHCVEMDRRCYTDFGLSEEILMEHAALGMADYIRTHFAKGSTILIVAGAGNNGADGIALARLLYQAYDVALYIPFGVKSPMAILQLKRVKLLGLEVCDVPKESDIIVDALFGAGLNKQMDRDTIALIRLLNSYDGYKIACDIPTGISPSGCLMPIAFEAAVTVTMGAYKEALYLDDAKESVGKVICVDLGIDASLYEIESPTYLLEAEDIQLPHRVGCNTHKGDFGHAAIFVGEKQGAGLLAGVACSRYGAGLTTLIVHETISAPPDLMQTTTLPERTTAIAIGMGLGDDFEEAFLQQYLLDSGVPVVLDADSFKRPELLDIVRQKNREIVLTPHPKEFVSLWQLLTQEQLSVAEVQAHRFDMVRRFTARYPEVTLLLKGANMLIGHNEECFINPLGTARLSKGGSGDVLSGLIVSLLAQGYSGRDAAIQGSLALTQAAASYQGASYAMLASDLIAQIAQLECS